MAANDDKPEAASRRTRRVRWPETLMIVLGLATFFTGLLLLILSTRVSNVTSVIVMTAGLAVVGLPEAIRSNTISFGGFEVELAQTRERIAETAGPASVSVPGHVAGDLHVHVSDTAGHDAATLRASEALRRQEAILEEIYTQGLAQARISFRISVFFGSVGAILLLIGVGLAILRASTDGQRYASIVAAVSGTVIELTSGVFFLQSNRARRNMGDQGVLLREESQEDRRLSAARELSGAIGDEALRDQVRADLARILVNSERIPAGRSASNTSPRPPVSASDEGPGDTSPQVRAPKKD